MVSLRQVSLRVKYHYNISVIGKTKTKKGFGYEEQIQLLKTKKSCITGEKVLSGVSQILEELLY